MKKILLSILVLISTALNASLMSKNFNQQVSFFTKKHKMKNYTIFFGFLAALKTAQGYAESDFRNFRKLFTKDLLWNNNNKKSLSFQYFLSFIGALWFTNLFIDPQQNRSQGMANPQQNRSQGMTGVTTSVIQPNQ